MLFMVFRCEEILNTVLDDNTLTLSKNSVQLTTEIRMRGAGVPKTKKRIRIGICLFYFFCMP